MNQESIIYFIFICSLVFLLFTICIVIGVRIYKSNQAKYNDDIIKLQTQFENDQLKAQIQVQETTFQHISREIHDNIGQKLSLAKLQLNTISHDEKGLIENVVQIITESLDDLRNLSRSLSAEFIAGNGFIRTLENEIEQLNRTGLYLFKLVVIGEPVYTGSEKDVVLFRIVQEALNNIMKHAQASEINIQLHYSGIALSVEIADNGKGFDINEVANSNGIKNIQNRATLLDGSALFESTPGKGTILKINIPAYGEAANKGNDG